MLHIAGGILIAYAVIALLNTRLFGCMMMLVVLALIGSCVAQH
jgi:hypothetical protein